MLSGVFSTRPERATGNVFRKRRFLGRAAPRPTESVPPMPFDASGIGNRWSDTAENEKKRRRAINLSRKAPIKRIRAVGYTLKQERGAVMGRNQNTEVEIP